MSIHLIGNCFYPLSSTPSMCSFATFLCTFRKHHNASAIAEADLSYKLCCEIKNFMP